MGCGCGLGQAPTTYTVQSGDTLTGIAVKLNLCVKGPGNTLKDWEGCLKVAKIIADANGVPWAGPPTWQAPIHPGQVLTIPAVEPQSGAGGGRSGLAWFVGLLGLLGVASIVGTPKKRKEGLSGADDSTTYKTFKRAATNWDDFSRARKTTVSRGLTYDQAREECRQFNENRTPSQIRKGLKMEFTAED